MDILLAIYSSQFLMIFPLVLIGAYKNEIHLLLSFIPIIGWIWIVWYIIRLIRYGIDLN
jgi:hypothetical protein